MLKTIEKFLDSKALLKSYCLVCRARASFVSEPRGRALSLPSNRGTGGAATSSLRLHQMANNGLERAQVEADGAVDLGVVVVVDGGVGRLWRLGPGVGAR